MICHSAYFKSCDSNFSSLISDSSYFCLQHLQFHLQNCIRSEAQCLLIFSCVGLQLNLGCCNCWSNRGDACRCFAWLAVYVSSSQILDCWECFLKKYHWGGSDFRCGWWGKGTWEPQTLFLLYFIDSMCFTGSLWCLNCRQYIMNCKI